MKCDKCGYESKEHKSDEDKIKDTIEGMKELYHLLVNTTPAKPISKLEIVL